MRGRKQRLPRQKRWRLPANSPISVKICRSSQKRRFHQKGQETRHPFPTRRASEKLIPKLRQQHGNQKNARRCHPDSSSPVTDVALHLMASRTEPMPANCLRQQVRLDPIEVGYSESGCSPTASTVALSFSISSRSLVRMLNQPALRFTSR